MKKAVANLIILVPLALVSACANLGSSEKEFLKELRSLGIPDDEQQVKSPPVAGALNILPGFGNFYLAYGTTESDQWMVGGLNLLTWPLSVLWGVPQGALDATTINKKATANYYQYDKAGKTKLARLRGRQPQYSRSRSQRTAPVQRQIRTVARPPAANRPQTAATWSTVGNTVRAYAGEAGTGSSGLMPSSIKLKLIENKGSWGLFEYADINGGRSRAWLPQNTVRRR